MLRTVIASALLTGCMNLTFNQMVEKPGTHDTPLTVVLVGGFGDLALATGAAAGHAAIADAPNESFGDEFAGVILYYALPVLAVDLVVALVRISNYKR